jgi:RimJ/RimL family protein N-acetyltransferase
MFFAVETHSLKDGAPITLRCGVEDDAAALLAVTRAYIHQNDGMVWEPEEYQKTEDEMRAWIHSMLHSDAELLLLALVDGNVVGNIDFHIGPRARLRHTGSIGMGVAPGYRGRGVGKILLGRLLAWACTQPQIERIELAAISNNLPAISLYKQFGFVEEGRRLRHFKYRDGTYADDVIMGLQL